MSEHSFLSPVWIVGFSGNRPKANMPGRSLDELQACAPQIRQALEDMWEVASLRGGRIELFTSLAEGGDLIAVQTAIDIGLPVHIILPLPLEEFRQDFEPGSGELKKMEALLEKAIESGGSMRVAMGSKTRPDCYSDAGYQMLSCSDACIFLDTGEAELGHGGTNDMIRIAEDLGLPSCIIDPAQREPPVVRSAKFAHPENPDLLLFREIAQLAGTSGGASEEDVFEALDSRANGSSRRIRKAAIWSSIANSGAALVAAFAIIFYGWLASRFGVESARVLTLIELIFVLAAVIFSLWIMRPAGQDRWLFSRMAAEILRGLHHTRGLLDPLSLPIPDSHQVWRRFALSASLNTKSASKADVSGLRDRYLTNRIDRQIDYFTRSHRKSSRVSRFVFLVFNISSWLAIPFVLLFIYAKLTMPFAEIPGIIKFLPILFPLTSGIVSSVNHALEISRRDRRYAAMIRTLAKTRTLLARLVTGSSIRHTVSRLEETIIQEQLEWLESVQTWTER